MALLPIAVGAAKRHGKLHLLVSCKKNLTFGAVLIRMFLFNSAHGEDGQSCVRPLRVFRNDYDMCSGFARFRIVVRRPVAAVPQMRNSQFTIYILQFTQFTIFDFFIILFYPFNSTSPDIHEDE